PLACDGLSPSITTQEHANKTGALSLVAVTHHRLEACATAAERSSTRRKSKPPQRFRHRSSRLASMAHVVLLKRAEFRARSRVRRRKNKQRVVPKPAVSTRRAPNPALESSPRGRKNPRGTGLWPVTISSLVELQYRCSQRPPAQG